LTALDWILARDGIHPSYWGPEMAMAVRGFAVTHHQALGVVASMMIIGCAVGMMHTWWRSVRQVQPDSPHPPKPRPFSPMVFHSELAAWQLGSESWLLGGPWGLAVCGGCGIRWPWPVISVPPMPPEMVTGWLQQLPPGRAPAWPVVERVIRSGACK